MLAVVLSSVGRLFFYLILRGSREAASINRIVTFAKIILIVVFVVIAIVAFKGWVFTDNFWGGDGNYFVEFALRAGQGHHADPRCSSSSASRVPAYSPGSPANARTSGVRR